jgi:uncharacterized repeat protein (TIGR01451 family)
MKTSSGQIRKALLPFLATCALVFSAAQLRADDESDNEYNRQYRSYYDVPLGDNYTGKSPYMRSTGRPQPPPPAPPRRVEVAPLPPPQMPERQSCSEITTGLIRMSKRTPAEVSLGQEFMYELNPTAVACAGNVVVTDQVPPGATYVRSEPPAEVSGDRLIWRLQNMEPGETRSLKVWLKADQEGRLASCATVSADPRVCASTFVGKPLLAITKTGPEMAQIDTDVTYNILVSNTGTAVAREVVVTDTVPDGLSHSSGQRQLTFNVGDLPPNQSKSIPVTLRATARGKVCNGAVAASSNAGQVNAQACTTIVKPGLKIVKSTKDKQLLINRTASYDLVVSNTGDVPLTGVVVTDTAAAETTIVVADGATVNGNTATWTIGDLAAGAEKTLGVKVVSRTPGKFCDVASVSSAQGLKDSSQDCTEWMGVTGVLLEMVDDPDPIQVGETTTFTIRVTNQGSTRDIEQLTIKSTFGEEMDPVTASGGATISGKTVTWPMVPTVGPKQVVTYTVVGKGLKAGDHRMQTEITTRLRQNPITKYESTTIY